MVHFGMRLRQLMFVLPNLFTVTSIFCGFYAMILCAGSARPEQLYQAALAIFFAIFFDGFDGRVARLTKTQSQFGVELDSLADVISFGVAPAILVYKWALSPLGLGGILICFAYTACGALRLARFNVIARRSAHGGGARFFVGLPIPLAAGVLISVVIAHHSTQGEPLGSWAHLPVAVGLGLLSLLMVSNFRYRTFKDIHPSTATLIAFGMICAAGMLIAKLSHPAYVLVAYFSLYLLLGLFESAIAAARRLLVDRFSPAGGDHNRVGIESEESGEIEQEDFL